MQTGSVPTAVATGGTGAAPGAPAATAASTDNTLLWVLLIVIVVAILALIGIVLLRQRRPAEAAVVAPAARASDVRRVPASTTTTQTQTAAPADTTTTTPPPPEETISPEAAAVSAGTAAAAATTVPLPQTPATITCPNCGTVNNTSENFCHECGQDLRPAIAALAAQAPASPAPPVDVVEADTPYLETLDRVDEQLEFVLSRPRVVIGTGAGNDIVVDSGFKGWRTVSPVHAELRREQEGFVIVDRDSEYGTFVNEMRTGENILSDGDLVRLGDVRFVYHSPGAEE